MQERKAKAFTMASIIFLLFYSFQFIFAQADDAIYDQYNQFCLDNFGAEHESLTYQFFGNDLEFVESGFWIHESRNSAAVGFETNLPALTQVEYGETTAYGHTTPVEERYFYLHLHYLTGLEPDMTYHYRLIVTDERANEITGEDRTFQTHALPDAIDVPGILSGPPYILNQAGAYYILTDDIDSDTRGISIKAGITLDLNGHTITYDEGPPLVQGEWNEYLYNDTSTSGIHYFVWNPTGQVHIYNGIVKQGQNNGQGHIGIGFNPILINGGIIEIAGITAEYAGHSVSGIECHWGTLSAHHNIILDKGTGIDNRHMGIKALYTNSIGTDGIHHNLIKRSRHQCIIEGVDSGSIYSNEIYQDSYDTNAFGIKPVTLVYDNKIFGTGYHVNAISWRSNITIRHNFIHLQGVEPTTRSQEYGAMASVNGIRLTQYDQGTSVYQNNLYEENMIIVKGRDGTSTMRGVQFSSDPYVSNLRFQNNTIKIEVQDEVTPEAACVVAHGLSYRDGEQLPIIYENNTFISNSIHVMFGDDYAIGGNHQFRNNTFIRFGDRDDYHTIQIGYWNLHTTGNRFFDSTLGEGVDLEDCEFIGSGHREYSVGHSLYAIAQDESGDPLTNQDITVEDNTSITFTAQTDSEGLVRLELLEYTYDAEQGVYIPTKTTHGNHTLTIDGYEDYLVDEALFAIHYNIDEPIVLTFESTEEDEHPPGGGYNGNDDDANENDEQIVYAPTANTGGPYTGYVNQSIVFNASSSNDDGHITNYSWDFGDNITGWGVVTTHTYLLPGNYTVNLTVLDNTSLFDWDTTTATIQQFKDNTSIITNKTGNDDNNTIDKTNNNSDVQQTPGFELILIINSIIFVLLIKCKRKKGIG